MLAGLILKHVPTLAANTTMSVMNGMTARLCGFSTMATSCVELWGLGASPCVARHELARVGLHLPPATVDGNAPGI